MNPDPFCISCVLPYNFPGIKISSDGKCNFCQISENSRKKYSSININHQNEISSILKSIPHNKTYDCILALSGGKDSSFTLYYITKVLKLKCLAVMMDNGFIAEETYSNIEKLVKILNVDFKIYKPDPIFLKSVFRESVLNKNLYPPGIAVRISNVCNSCISMINTHLLNLALENDIPIIAGGFLKGQTPSRSAIQELNPILQKKLKENNLSRLVNNFGHRAKEFYDIKEENLSDNKLKKLFLFNPLVELNISEEEKIKKLIEIGWVLPENTGLNSTNCLLNDFGIWIHYRQFGFHPYAFEISEQVRAGEIDRVKALKKIFKPDNMENFLGIMKNLEIDLKS